MNTNAVTAVRQAEAIRLAALRRNDAETLESLLAEELVYLHSGGERDTRASYLASMRGGELRYRPDLDIRETAIEARAGDAEVSALMTGSVMIHGAERRLNSQTLCVWRLTSGAWRLARFEAKPL